MFLSEILSAKTIVPIIEHLAQDPEFELQLFNDGFCIDYIRSLGLAVTYVLSDFDNWVKRQVANSDLVLMGKSYREPSEYSIIRAAEFAEVPVLMVVPDMGFEIIMAKLEGLGRQEEPGLPHLLFADGRSLERCRQRGLPDERLLPFGNPYFDQLYCEVESDPRAPHRSGICYFSTPFELDFARGILPSDYCHQELIGDIRSVCTELGEELIAKRHPQVEEGLFHGIRIYDGSPLDVIRRISVAVGSYSTTLLEAYAAGVPAVSYQPWDANIRSDVFEGRIPIAKTSEALKSLLVRALAEHSDKLTVRPVTFNPGRSLAEIKPIIRATIDLRAKEAKRSAI